MFLLDFQFFTYRLVLLFVHFLFKVLIIQFLVDFDFVEENRGDTSCCKIANCCVIFIVWPGSNLHVFVCFLLVSFFQHFFTMF